MSAALEDTDLHLLLCLASSGRGRSRLTNLLHTRGVDGIMLMALRGDDPLSHIVRKAGLPAVYGGRPLHFEPQWYVDSDNLGGARLATEHLIGLGRTRIVTITGQLGTEVGEARYRGYREAMIMAGLTPYGMAEGDFTEAGGAAAMKTLLDRHPDLDAVFAASDNMAAGALRVLGEAGRSVPADVAVVGFDDLGIAQRTDPPLTTVHQSIQALGTEMTRMLIGLIAGQERYVHHPAHQAGAARLRMIPASAERSEVEVSGSLARGGYPRTAARRTLPGCRGSTARTRGDQPCRQTCASCGRAGAPSSVAACWRPPGRAWERSARMRYPIGAAGIGHP